SEAGAQAGIVAHGGDDSAAPGHNPYLFPVADTIARAVFRTQVEALPMPQGRGIRAGLDTCVVGVEASSGRQSQWELLIEEIQRRVIQYNGERRASSFFCLVRLPEPAVQKRSAGIRLVFAGPLDPPKLFQACIAHTGMHG